MKKLCFHQALPYQSMPSVFFVLICDAWEICFILCKQRDKSKLFDVFVYETSNISPMHHKSKQVKQKAWDDGVAPSVNVTWLTCRPASVEHKQMDYKWITCRLASVEHKQMDYTWLTCRLASVEHTQLDYMWLTYWITRGSPVYWHQ